MIARIRLTTAAAVIAAAVVFTGCRDSSQTPPPKTPVNIPSADIRISLTMKPVAPRQMDPVAFTVHVADGHGAPVNGATVSADLVMPSMDMGKNAVRFQSAGPGTYLGSGRFTMDGDWDVGVTAVRRTDKAVRTFPVRVR